MEKYGENFLEKEKIRKDVEAEIFIGEEFDRRINEKEFRERERIVEYVSEKIVPDLIKNAGIIDHILAEEGASLELATNFQKYAEKIAKYDYKKIALFSSVIDFFRNSATTMLGCVERIYKNNNEIEKKKKENVIIKEFNFLRNYLYLLETYDDFEREELCNRSGYLHTREIKGNEYLKTSAEKLEESGSKRKGLAH